MREYPPIKHEDGLETSILGLDFEVTQHSFPKKNELSLMLRCSSSVSTVNSEAQTTETHHQKSSVHFSYGSLFRASKRRMADFFPDSTDYCNFCSLLGSSQAMHASPVVALFAVILAAAATLSRSSSSASS